MIFHKILIALCIRQPFPCKQNTNIACYIVQMEQLPLSGGHRESLVHKFIHLLEKKAFTLIKYIETHRFVRKNVGIEVVSLTNKQIR